MSSYLYNTFGNALTAWNGAKINNNLEINKKSGENLYEILAWWYEIRKELNHLLIFISASTT